MNWPNPKRRLRSRFGALILALLQFGVSTAVVSADALMDGQSDLHGTHVESSGNEDCGTHHDHLFCQVVRSLSHAAGASPGVDPGADFALTVHVMGPRSVDFTRPKLLSGTIGSRAPPLG